VITDTPERLIAAAKALPVIELKTNRPVDATQLHSLAGVQDVHWQQTAGSFRTTSVGATLVALVQYLELQNVQIVDLQLRQPTLEDVFIELTGSSLRD
jgi:ABC-2 type transport system ATP-binding protein